MFCFFICFCFFVLFYLFLFCLCFCFFVFFVFFCFFWFFGFIWSFWYLGPQAGWPAGWLPGRTSKIHFWHSLISLMISLCKVAPQATFEAKWEKSEKSRISRNSRVFLNSWFFTFLSFCSESGLGSHFAKGNCKGNVTVPKMDFSSMVKPVSAARLIENCKCVRSVQKLLIGLFCPNPICN